MVCDVKEINASPRASPTGALDPYAKTSSAIKGKAEQPKALKGKYPFVAVVRKTNIWPVDTISVMGAMFGHLNIAWTLNDQGGSAGDMRVEFGREAMLQAQKNRVVSAVAILDRFNPTKVEADAEISRRVDPLRGDHVAVLQVIKATYAEFEADRGYVPNLLVPYLKVFPNPHATVPLRHEVFSGQHDRQWGLLDGMYGLVAEGLSPPPS